MNFVTRHLGCGNVKPFLLIFFLVGLFHAGPAKSGCPSWSDASVNGNSAWIYGGSLGNHTIRMLLQFDPATRALTGTYGYNNEPGVLSISGEISTDGESAKLVEHNSSGQATGRFVLIFVYPTWQEGWDRQGKKSDWNCMFMTGTWEDMAGKHSAKVALSRINPMSSLPSNEQARKKNETAAYQFQQAVLRGDRAKFAALLKYPFSKQSITNGKVVWKEWDSPNEVVKNYKKIMTLSAKDVRMAVPHELETSFGTSSFMSTYACITDGKFVLICDGGCRCPPYSN
jgi:hypothetical protein